MVYEPLYHAREIATNALYSGYSCKAKSARSSNINFLLIVFDKTIIPLTLVGYEMIIISYTVLSPAEKEVIAGWNLGGDHSVNQGAFRVRPTPKIRREFRSSTPSGRRSALARKMLCRPSVGSNSYIGGEILDVFEQNQFV